MDLALWYLARVTGLMAWTVACLGVLAALVAMGLGWRRTVSVELVWTIRRFLTVAMVGFAAAHGVAVVASSRVGLDGAEALTARRGGAWLPAGVITGAAAGWLVIIAAVVAAVRHARTDGMSRGGVDLVAMVTVVALGTHHAWQVGSDTRNPVAVGLGLLAVVAISTVAWLVLRGLRQPPIVPLRTGPGFSPAVTRGHPPGRPPPPTHRD